MSIYVITSARYAKASLLVTKVSCSLQAKLSSFFYKTLKMFFSCDKAQLTWNKLFLLEWLSVERISLGVQKMAHYDWSIHDGAPWQLDWVPHQCVH